MSTLWAYASSCTLLYQIVSFPLSSTARIIFYSNKLRKHLVLNLVWHRSENILHDPVFYKIHPIVSYICTIEVTVPTVIGADCGVLLFVDLLEHTMVPIIIFLLLQIRVGFVRRFLVDQ